MLDFLEYLNSKKKEKISKRIIKNIGRLSAEWKFAVIKAVANDREIKKALLFDWMNNSDLYEKDGDCLIFPYKRMSMNLFLDKF